MSYANESRRWDGTSRTALPGEQMPDTPDPAQGVDGVAWTIGLVGAFLTAALVGHVLLRVFA